jgi:hypothetical protein
LLAAQLEDPSVVVPLAVERAIEVCILVSGGDIDARVWIGVVGAPAAHVDPKLARAPLDAQVLERPELHRRQIEDASRSVVEIVDLDPVIEHPHALEIADVRGCLRCGQPARSERCHAGNAIEQIDDGERSRRE